MTPLQTKIPVLQTERLILRAPVADDATALGDFYESPRSVGVGGPFPRQDADAAIARNLKSWSTNGFGFWMVTLRDTSQPVGRVGLLAHEGFEGPELGWHVFDTFEGKGMAFEAALAARAHANGPMGFGPLYSFVEPTNPRSRKLAERLGATHERDIEHDGLQFHLFRHPKSGRSA